MEKVVITGVGIETAVASDYKEFSQALHYGIAPEFIRHQVDEIEYFAAKLPPDRLKRLKAQFSASLRCHLRTAPEYIYWAIKVAKQAVEMSCLTPDELTRCCLVIAGGEFDAHYRYTNFMLYQQEPEYIKPSYALAHMDIDVLGAISEVFPVIQDGFIINGASASGNIALIRALQLMRAGVYERCLIVSPPQFLSPVEIQSFIRAGAMMDATANSSSTAIYHPFDEQRYTGFIYGQGAAALVVERNEVALLRGAVPLVSVSGAGVSLAGLRTTAPSLEGEIAAMKAAMQEAGVVPTQINYINTHGTGSSLGDNVEAEAILRLFSDSPSLRINATKALSGHCLSASALIEIVAVCAQIQQQFVHANPELNIPIAKLPFVGIKSETWSIQHAIANSFAFSGVHTSLVLSAR
ncbi:putative polyketide beta-ketoacyl synthase [Xenorhabdus nematophila ATCC 19061]|uniref:Polyketide beta-ketoacyl synthase n=1 Tax=Xenorhabdus nematophila (strain ATCC 19061 / DSM 3370 / CCUG 14189 / LMG 1036 / NCIMB 9965 / AN6) TaxID=406817 RepID=D3VCW2_XENNA|nr:beta-ketoacyl synthase N-terminal-like domain-containing protein [Xenorhabdus nematophila]CBJ89828.1 putative polyketide beta-ketoacyl synthase [Xenorhabdus nematophila ATCC 19061]CEK22713.1 putative polyketide beta-ketoacyl synthase [Xenorhabdus nematophila AN6/1]